MSKLKPCFLTALAVVLLVNAHSANAQEAGLAELAAQARPGFLMGTHVSLWQKGDLLEAAKTRDTITREYNLISVGIYQRSMQRRSQDDWDFDSVDTIIAFAEEHDLTVYAHPMFGSDGYLPDWLLEGEFTDEELLAIIEERIKTVLTRYRGKIDILDVYNEGFGINDGLWREHQNLFLRLGWRENEYGRWPVALEKMLVWCRKYGGEDLKLIYNDNYNVLVDAPQSASCIQLYKALKHEGIPIDGIGIQCHTRIDEDGVHQLGAGPKSRHGEFDADSFAANLRAMEEAGIDVHITECDVHLYGEIDDEKLALQADAYRSILAACFNEPACKSFKTWGFTDASCWKPMQKNNRGYQYEPCPLVFDHDCEPKPAYRAMKKVLAQEAARK